MIERELTIEEQKDVEFCRKQVEGFAASIRRRPAYPFSADMDQDLRAYQEFSDAIREPDLAWCRRLREKSERQGLVIKTAALAATAVVAVVSPGLGALLFAPWVANYFWKLGKKTNGDNQ